MIARTQETLDIANHETEAEVTALAVHPERRGLSVILDACEA